MGCCKSELINVQEFPKVGLSEQVTMKSTRETSQKPESKIFLKKYDIESRQEMKQSRASSEESQSPRLVNPSDNLIMRPKYHLNPQKDIKNSQNSQNQITSNKQSLKLLKCKSSDALSAGRQYEPTSSIVQTREKKNHRLTNSKPTQNLKISEKYEGNRHLSSFQQKQEPVLYKNLKKSSQIAQKTQIHPTHEVDDGQIRMSANGFKLVSSTYRNGDKINHDLSYNSDMDIEESDVLSRYEYQMADSQSVKNTKWYKEATKKSLVK